MPPETRAARRKTLAWVVALLSAGLLPALGGVAGAESFSPAGGLEWRQVPKATSRQGIEVSTATSQDDLPRVSQHSMGQVAASSCNSPAWSEDPLYDDSLWEHDPPDATRSPFEKNEVDAETVTAATIELVDHSILTRTNRQPSLQLPGSEDRSIRVSVLDDPFDDSEDPFEEPLIDEGDMEETGEGEDRSLENRDDGLTELEQTEGAVDQEEAHRQQEGDEPQPNDPMQSTPFEDDPPEDDSDPSLATPSPAAADSTPSTFKPMESGAPDNRQPDRSAEILPESGREDFSEDSLQRTPGEEPDEGQLEKDLMAKELAENEKNCAEEFAQIRSARIDSIDLNIRVAGKPGEDYPYECSLGSDLFSPRCWPPTTYLWKASGLCHKPLYFEQVQLERYGHSWGPYLQPLVSGAHFFASIPILPYKMGLKTPNECVYSLGYYRPGSCAPYLLDPIPFTWRAALFEAGFVVGAAAAIP